MQSFTQASEIYNSINQFLNNDILKDEKSANLEISNLYLKFFKTELNVKQLNCSNLIALLDRGSEFLPFFEGEDNKAKLLRIKILFLKSKLVIEFNLESKDDINLICENNIEELGKLIPIAKENILLEAYFLTAEYYFLQSRCCNLDNWKDTAYFLCMADYHLYWILNEAEGIVGSTDFNPNELHNNIQRSMGYLLNHKSKNEILSVYRSSVERFLLDNPSDNLDKDIDDLYSKHTLEEVYELSAKIGKKEEVEGPHKGEVVDSITENVRKKLQKQFFKEHLKKLDKIDKNITNIEGNIKESISNSDMFSLIKAFIDASKMKEKLEELKNNIDNKYESKIKYHYQVLNSSVSRLINKCGQLIIHNEEFLENLKLQQGPALAQQYYWQIYNSVERLFLACKQIASELISHTYKGTLGTISSLVSSAQSLIAAIPVYGSPLATALGILASIGTEVDYQRTVQQIKNLDNLLSEDSAKYLAHYLSEELVNRHYKQLQCIVALPESKKIFKITDWGREKVIGKNYETIYSRVAAYFCFRIFEAVLGIGKKEPLIQDISMDFQQNGVKKLLSIGNRILEDIVRVPQGLLSTVDKKWKELNQAYTMSCSHNHLNVDISLFEYFCSAPVLTNKATTFKRKINPTVETFGIFLQDNEDRVNKRKSLEIYKESNLPLPAYEPFQADFSINALSFPAIYSRLMQAEARIKELENQLLQKLNDNPSEIKGSTNRI